MQRAEHLQTQGVQVPGRAAFMLSAAKSSEEEGSTVEQNCTTTDTASTAHQR